MSTTTTITQTARTIPVKVTLNVTSDTICPWCYIGFKQINNAIQRAKDAKLPITFDVEFSPFMLDPSLPEHGTKPRWLHYNDKFGAERARAIKETLGKVGKELGIDFKYDGVISQTTASHRILSKAYQLGGQDAQQKLLDIIFPGFFEANKDVADLDWLSECAAQTGVMSAQEAKKFLLSDELVKETARKIELAQMMGITGVPFTIVNGKWALSGAQPSEVFYQVFEKLARDPRPKGHGHVEGHSYEAETCEAVTPTPTHPPAENCEM